MTETLSATAARNFVGGAWQESAAGETYEKRNPWRPSEVTGVVRRLDGATTPGRPSTPRATRSRPGRALPAPARAAFFFKAADALEARVEQIAQDMTAEMGKPLREARDGGRARGGDPALFSRRGVPARRARSTSRRSAIRRSTRGAGRSASSA